jgi:hypothetical protein
LKDDLKNTFPITQRSQLANLRKYVDLLRDHYHVPSKLPNSYFQLPPPKLPLPPSYKDLPLDLATQFPVTNDPISIQLKTKLLRENNFAVKQLPRDYIIVKRPLPPVHWYAENNAILLPINHQDEVQEFITHLKNQFTFKLPLDSNWIKEGLDQYNKPLMPSEFNVIEEKLNITSDQLHTNSKDFKDSIKKIKENFAGPIPREWISPLLPDLPSLENTISYLNNHNISLTLPILDNQNFTDNINTLKTIFYFERLPPDFITDPESPDPELTHLPSLF